jgi:hypothetical protein
METTPSVDDGKKSAREVAKLLTMPNMTFSTLKNLGVVSKLVASPSALISAASAPPVGDSSRLFRKLQNTFTNRLTEKPEGPKPSAAAARTKENVGDGGVQSLARFRGTVPMGFDVPVQVALRVCPLSTYEVECNEASTLSAVPNGVTVRAPPEHGGARQPRGGAAAQTPWRTPVKPRPKTFSFDRVFHHGDSVYEASVRPLVRAVFDGQNGTVLAYGASNSGKTYSIMGGTNYVGILPRCVSDLFSRAKQLSTADCEYKVSIGYVALHMNEFQDLLAPTATSALTAPVEVVDGGARGGMALKGPSSLRTAVATAEEAIVAIRQGNVARAQVRATYGTARRAKAHSIVSFYVSATGRRDGRVSRTTKLHVIDLAGNEEGVGAPVSPGQPGMGTIGGRSLKEIEAVNLSLTCLSNVLMSLANPGSTDLWLIPYRNSKLTHFLKDSLGGRSRTLLLAHVRSNAASYRQTLRTLHYASKACGPGMGRGRGRPAPHAGIPGRVAGFTPRDASDASLLREKLRQINLYQEQIVERDGQVRQLEAQNSAACQATEDLRETMAALAGGHERELDALNAKIRELQTVADPRLFQELDTLREKRVASERAHAEERATLAAKIGQIEARSLHEADVIDELRADLERSRAQLAERVKELVHSRAVAVQGAELARVNAELASLYEREAARRARLETVRARDDHEGKVGKLECALVQRNSLANLSRSLVDQVAETREYAKHLEAHIEKAGRKLQKQKQTRSKILEGLADSEALTTDFEKKWRKAEKEVARLKGILKAAKSRRSNRHAGRKAGEGGEEEEAPEGEGEEDEDEDAPEREGEVDEDAPGTAEALAPVAAPRAERLSAVAEEEEEEEEVATATAQGGEGAVETASAVTGGEEDEVEREVLGKRKSFDPSQLAEIDDLLGDTDDSDDADESFDLGTGLPALSASRRTKRRG